MNEHGNCENCLRWERWVAILLSRLVKHERERELLDNALRYVENAPQDAFGGLPDRRDYDLASPAIEIRSKSPLTIRKPFPF